MTSAEAPEHGGQIPTPRWWRRFRYIPLTLLVILSIVAAIIGWTAQYRLDRANNAIASVPRAGDQTASSDACRTPVELPAGSPWTDDRDKAESVWTAHAKDLAGPVVRGADGWAFYNDQIEQNFSQAIGRRLLTVSETAKWRDYFTSIADALEAKGIELSIEITPSSSSVYPENLPSWAEKLRGPTPLDQLLMDAPHLPLLDFRADLRAEAKKNAVYTPVNSHWTDWGGYVGWKTYAACHDARYPQNPKIVVPDVAAVRSKGVYNEYASYGIADATPEWTAPVFAAELPDVTVTDKDQSTKTVSGSTPVDLTSLPASTENAKSASPQKALILRDSMGGALSTFWDQQYAQTWQLQHRYDDWSSPPNYANLVAQYQPDVVIIQLAERHLVNAPPTTSGF